jgi:hypothetical protein
VPGLSQGLEAPLVPLVLPTGTKGPFPVPVPVLRLKGASLVPDSQVFFPTGTVALSVLVFVNIEHYEFLSVNQVLQKIWLLKQ